MMEKIEWYQEVLKLDPDSKVFFPLAKLLRDSQQPEKAIDVLRAGLQRTSIYLEARLLLIQLLFEQSRKEEYAAELSAVTDSLEAYPALWEVWADSVALRNRDLALAIRLMASTIRHPERSLSLILESGLEILEDVRRTFAGSPVGPQSQAAAVPSLAHEDEASDDSENIPETFPVPRLLSSDDTSLLRFEEQAPSGTASAPPSEEGTEGRSFLEHADLLRDENEEPTLRTRSMADVLAEQGDIAGALEIYQELEAAAPTPEEARELHDSVIALAARVSRSGEGMEKTGENENGPFFEERGEPTNLMSLLESLADRLEARARA